LDDRFPSAAAELPCTSTDSDSVSGTSTSNTPSSSRRGFSSSESASTAMAAVISLCTLSGTCRTSSTHLETAPACRTSSLFLSDEAARLRSVEMAWHWISSLSVVPSRSTSGIRKPASMIGDSFDGWIEMLRMQATADRINGRYEDLRSLRRGERPRARTMSSW